MDKLLDITEVSYMFGITSRTLRFYEHEGLIESTTNHLSTRRQYNEEQISKIKKVLVLRSLGLPIRKIQELQQGDNDLISAIVERKSELIAYMVTKAREMNHLDEMLSFIEKGEDIYDVKKEKYDSVEINHARMGIVNNCTEAFVSGNYAECFEYFSDNLKEYTPLLNFSKVCEDTIKPIGKFILKDKTQLDTNLNNVIYVYLRYEKLGLYIKYVFQRNQIHGIWLNYYEV